MDASRIGRTPRIGRPLHPAELEKIDPKLRGDVEPPIVATIEPDEDDPKLRTRRVGDTSTQLPIDAALAKLEAVVAAERTHADERLAALRATFNEEIKRVPAVIADCDQIEEQLRPLAARVEIFLASRTWARLFAAAPHITKKRAAGM